MQVPGDRGPCRSNSPTPPAAALLGLPPMARVDVLDNESFDPSLLDDFETYPYLWYAEQERDADQPARSRPAPRWRCPARAPTSTSCRRAPKSGNGRVRVRTRSSRSGRTGAASAGLTFWYYGQNSGGDIGVRLVNNRPPATSRRIGSSPGVTSSTAAPVRRPNAEGLGPGRRRRHDQRHARLGQRRAGVLHRRHRQRRDRRPGQPADHRAARPNGSLMCYYGPCEYTSARLLTKDRFEIAYGRIEARDQGAARRGLVAGILDARHRHRSRGMAADRRDRHHGARRPRAQPRCSARCTARATPAGRAMAAAVTWASRSPTPSTSSRSSGSQTGSRGSSTASSTSRPRRTTRSCRARQWVFNHPFFMLLNRGGRRQLRRRRGRRDRVPAEHARRLRAAVPGQARPRELRRHRSATTSPAGSRSRCRSPRSRTQDGMTLDLAAIRSLALRRPGRHAAAGADRRGAAGVRERRDRHQRGRQRRGLAAHALGSVCTGGTVHVAPALAGQTITLTSGPLTLGKNVTIDAAGAPGLTISGNHTDRVVIVNAGTAATIRSATLADGYGWQLAGGVLNNGALTLDHVVVTGNTMATNAGDFWQGGGGIYNGVRIDPAPRRQHRLGQHAPRGPVGALCLLQHDHHHPAQHHQRQRVQRCRWRHPVAGHDDRHQQHDQRQHGDGLARRRDLPDRRRTWPSRARRSRTTSARTGRPRRSSSVSSAAASCRR